MPMACIRGGSAAMAMAALGLLLGGPLRAADQTGVRTVAEELGSRTKTQEAPADAPKGLSDSRVRVMATFALSILPDEIPDKSGAMIKLDKSDPNKYLIPLEDARRIIKVATRSAYAEACNLPELEKANYETMMRGERARNVWNVDQMMFVTALHTFATSYFAGNVKITEQADDPAAAAAAGAKPAVPAQPAAQAKPAAGVTTITTQKLQCSPEQKERVSQAITAYVQSAQAPAAAAPAAAAPPAEAAGAAPAAASPN
jgi:hypothetical protein